MGIMVTNFEEDDNSPAQNVNFKLKGLEVSGKIKVFTLDEQTDCEITEEFEITSENMDISLEIPLFTVKELLITK